MNEGLQRFSVCTVVDEMAGLAENVLDLSSAQIGERLGRAAGQGPLPRQGKLRSQR
ncbi:hypothetical protein TPA0908_33420 [Micromonospora sp. AKA38]|nr:hypothetical protein TPA0908_33420 [Micromonospora sp. AKA38]